MKALISAVVSMAINSSTVEALETRRMFSGATEITGISGSALPIQGIYVDVPFATSLAVFNHIPASSSTLSAGESPSVRINWGDGTPTTLISADAISRSLQGGAFQVSAMHAYVQIRTYRVTVSFLEGSRIRAKVTPVISVGTESAGGVTIDSSITQVFSGIVGTFSGFGTIASADKSGVSIDWGDGQTSNGPVTDLGNDDYQVSANHQYSIPGIHPIQVSASFTSGASAINKTIDSTAIVHRSDGSAAAPPVQGSAQLEPDSPGLVAGETQSGASIFAMFANAPYEAAAMSQYSATVRFSGMPTQVLDSSSFNPAFDDMGDLDLNINVPIYNKPAHYLATIKLFRDGRVIGRLTVPIPVTVNSEPSNVGADSPFGGTGVTIRPVAGVSFSGSVGTIDGDTFDGNPAMVSIQWGDGTTSPGDFEQTDGGGELSPGDFSAVFKITGGHTYAAPGRYRIRIISGFAGFPGVGATPPSLQTDSTAIVRARNATG